MKVHLKRSRMTQISASYHLPVKNYECTKKFRTLHIVCYRFDCCSIDRKKPAVKGSKDKVQKSSSLAGEEGSGAPLVFVPRGKEQRTKEEEKMKSLKWNFASPRAEHIEQLKEQMQSCVSAALFTQLFHADFKQHLAALAIMTKVRGQRWQF